MLKNDSVEAFHICNKYGQIESMADSGDVESYKSILHWHYPRSRELDLCWVVLLVGAAPKRERVYFTFDNKKLTLENCTRNIL